MTQTSTRLRLLEVVNKFLRAKVSEEAFASARRLDDLVPIDSLTLLEYVIGVEGEFGIDLTSRNLGREFLTDIDALAAYLDKEKGE